ncbi:MAG: hypothetical protein R3185_01425, partial [Candidatus Thermoplasmatota archaeon]|nr:hypothetical protein [Candidatus Thermoplasmatota archaeon]
MHHVVVHPWRSAPKGDLTLVLDAQAPSLHLAFLAEGADTAPGAKAETKQVLGAFTLHQSPDERVPDV